MNGVDMASGPDSTAYGTFLWDPPNSPRFVGLKIFVGVLRNGVKCVKIRRRWRDEHKVKRLYEFKEVGSL